MCVTSIADVKQRQFPIPAREWVEIVSIGKSIIPQFGGQAHSYRVTVDHHADIAVKWRRFSGTELVAHGSFTGSTDFNLPPSDRNIRVEVRAPEAVTLVAKPIPVPQKDAPKRLLAKVKRKTKPRK